MSPLKLFQKKSRSIDINQKGKAKNSSLSSNKNTLNEFKEISQKTTDKSKKKSKQNLSLSSNHED